MEDTISYLMRQAKQKGICSDGYSQMRSGDLDVLVDYYIANPDWCLERDYPTLPFLRENFSDIESKGVFVDRKFNGELLNDLQAYVFHNCSGTVKVGLNVAKRIIPMLYIANRCRLRIVGAGEYRPHNESQRTEVPIYSFGKNDISAKDNVFVKFVHYNHDLI